MTKKKFNINEWTPEPQQRESAPSTPVAIPENLQDSDIEIVTQRIEAAGTDITANYQDWLGLAFALAGELGEAGRSYFKRLSRFYPGYDEQEADKKFSSCLASGKGSVGISTFFHLGQKAGVSVSVKRLSAGANADFLRLGKKRSPRFPEAHCWFLQLAYGRRLTHSGGGHYSHLGVSSQLLIYDRRRVYANLYLFVTAQASAGKGRLALCKNIVLTIHEKLRAEYARLKQVYDEEMTNSSKAKRRTVSSVLRNPQ